jgi:hypothetical protein
MDWRGRATTYRYCYRFALEIGVLASQALMVTTSPYYAIILNDLGHIIIGYVHVTLCLSRTEVAGYLP